MNFFLNIALNIAVPLVIQGASDATGLLTPVGFLQGMVMGLLLGYACGDLIPAKMWGDKLAAKLNLRGISAHLVSCAVLALVFVTVLLFTISFINNVVSGGMAGVVGFFLLVYPGVLTSAYAAIVVTLPLAVKLSAICSGFDPAKAQGETA